MPGGEPGRPSVAFVAALSGCVLAASASMIVFATIWGFQSSSFSPRIDGGFRLIDQRGAAVTDRTWPARYKLLYFGYTSCPDACPLTLGKIADVLDRLGADARRVQPLFITVDPEHDRPGIMAAYTAQFSPRIVGLTGSRQQISRVTAEFHIRADRQTEPDGADVIAHTHMMFLMAPDGDFVGEIDPDANAGDIARSIRHVL